MKISDLQYEDQFYWKGVRYKQFIRPKKPKGKFTVLCCVAFGEGEYIDMPAGRKVKPVVRIDKINES